MAYQSGAHRTGRVVSGIQPTGNLHLGNYLGALVNWRRMQDDYHCLFTIVDLHAITTWQDPTVLRKQVLEMTAGVLASGIDPDRAILFNQSAVREHTELAWILNCTTRTGWLNRMTQFKDKSASDREGASVGLYAYPVLQAADILVYHATHVPVGDDQKQHLELARDIAQKFNTDYGVEFFPHPEPVIGKRTARVMSLRDGFAKMSKSDPSDMSRINLIDSSDAIANKIKKAKTDPAMLPDDPKQLHDRPEAKNLVGIYAALNGQTEEDVLKTFAGKGFGAFKPALADLCTATLQPVREEFCRLMDDHVYLISVLDQGARNARKLAGPVMEQVRKIIGLDLA